MPDTSLKHHDLKHPDQQLLVIGYGNVFWHTFRPLQQTGQWPLLQGKGWETALQMIFCFEITNLYHKIKHLQEHHGLQKDWMSW